MWYLITYSKKILNSIYQKPRAVTVANSYKEAEKRSALSSAQPQSSVSAASHSGITVPTGAALLVSTEGRLDPQ